MENTLTVKGLNILYKLEFEYKKNLLQSGQNSYLILNEFCFNFVLITIQQYVLRR